MIAEMNQRMQQQPVVVNLGGAKRKTAKAVKQPDGSYIMESIEQDIEGTGLPGEV